MKVDYLMDIKREEGYFDETNEEEGGVGGDDVGGGGVVVKEEEVEEVVEEEVVGVKRKAEEETEPRKTKKVRKGNGYYWTAEEDDALLKGLGKHGLDLKRIKKEDDGNVLADRNLKALYKRLYTQYPEKYKELRAAAPWKPHPRRRNAWTSEDDAALKRGVEVHGSDWEKIMSNNELLKRRKSTVIKKRYNRLLRK